MGLDLNPPPSKSVHFCSVLALLRTTNRLSDFLVEHFLSRFKSSGYTLYTILPSLLISPVSQCPTLLSSDHALTILCLHLFSFLLSLCLIRDYLIIMARRRLTRLALLLGPTVFGAPNQGLSFFHWLRSSVKSINRLHIRSPHLKTFKIQTYTTSFPLHIKCVYCILLFDFMLTFGLHPNIVILNLPIARPAARPWPFYAPPPGRRRRRIGKLRIFFS